MALGERLNFFRRKCNLTMNALGRMLGFDPKSADVRISQYEKDAKMPKEELKSIINDLGGRAEVSDMPTDELIRAVQKENANGLTLICGSLFLAAKVKGFDM